MFERFTKLQYGRITNFLNVSFDQYKWAYSMVTSRVAGLYLSPG